MTNYALFGVFLGGVGTFAIYSFLYKENRFYRIFEHVFIGIGVGIGVTETFRTFLLPEFIMPIWREGVVGLYFSTRSGWLASAGGPAWDFMGEIAKDSWSPKIYLWLFPAAFGSLYYTIYSRKFNWLARAVIGFGIGAAGGFAFEAFFSEFLPQIFAAFRPVVVFNTANGGFNWELTILNIVITTATLATMSYFLFTIDRSRFPGLEQTASTGRFLMMISFGAIFGSTVTARLALLIERLQFLVNDWFPLFWFWRHGNGG